MALSRLRTWLVGETLSASDLNGEFNNLLTNALSLLTPLTANLAAGGNKFTGLGPGTATGDSLRFEQNVPATQAEQQTATSVVVPVTSGRQHFHPSAAKAWGLANFAGSLAASYNMASVTDGGTGDMTFTLTNGLTSPSCPIGCGDSNGQPLAWRMRANLQLVANQYSTGTPTDGNTGSCVVFGTLP